MTLARALASFAFASLLFAAGCHETPTTSLAQGGFIVSSEREAGGDIYPDHVRADIYFELPSTHEQVVTIYNAAGYGPGGKGYQLLKRR